MVPEATVPDPPEIPKPYPGLWQGLWILARYILLQFAFAIPFAIADYVTKGKLLKQPIILAVVTLAAGVVSIRACCHRLGISFQSMAGAVPRLSIFPPVALTVVGLLLAELPLLGWILKRFPSLDSKQDFGLSESMWGAFLLIVLVAPVIEESLFRGILLKGFIARYSVMRGILLSAALFGALHVSLVKLIPTVSLGLVLGWLYSELGSIWPGVFAHACNNSVAFLAAFSAIKLKPTQPTVPPPAGAEWILSLAGLFLLACGLAALRADFARNRPPSAEEDSGAADAP
ncbi:MAG TPA: type II CAAX endopeptidase family protein [Bryobacteraceae bacterium]